MKSLTNLASVIQVEYINCNYFMLVYKNEHDRGKNRKY